MWIYKNNVIFRNFNAHPTHTFNLKVNLFEDIRYHNVVSRILDQDDSTCPNKFKEDWYIGA